MISDETRAKLKYARDEFERKTKVKSQAVKKAYEDLTLAFKNVSLKTEKFKDAMLNPPGLDTSVSGRINSERAVASFQQLNSQFLSGAINFSSTLILKNYTINFSYAVEPSLRVMSSSLGGYFDILATASADQERLKQQYRVMGIQNMVTAGSILAYPLASTLASSMISRATAASAGLTASSIIRIGLPAALQVIRAGGTIAAATQAAGVALGVSTAAGSLPFIAAVIAFIKPIIIAAVATAIVYGTVKILELTEPGQKLLDNIYDGLGTFKNNLLDIRPEVYENFLALNEEFLYSRSEEALEEIRDSLPDWLKFAAPILQAITTGALGNATSSQAITLGVIDAVTGYSPLDEFLDELTKIAQNKSLMEIFKPDALLSVYRDTAFLMGTEIGNRGTRGDGMELLVGSEFEDSLFFGEDLEETRSLVSRVYELSYFGQDFSLMGPVDLRTMGIGTPEILSVASNLERSTQTGYSEGVISTILSYSGVLSGGNTSKMQHIMQSIIRGNDFNQDDVNVATEKFEELFAAVVGNGKPQAAHLKLVSSLTDFSKDYGALVKMNFDATTEVAKVQQFMSDDGSIEGRFDVTATKTLIKSLDDVLLKGAMFTDLNSVQILNALGLSREEAIRGITSDANIFEKTLSGIISFLGVSPEDIINQTGSFNVAFQNFSLMTGMGAAELNPLAVALRRYVSGERVESIKDEYMANIEDNITKSIQYVQGALESAASFSEIQKNIIYSSNKLLSVVNENLNVITSFQFAVNEVVLEGFGNYATASVNLIKNMTEAIRVIEGASSSVPLVPLSPLPVVVTQTSDSSAIPQNLLGIYNTVYSSIGEDFRHNFSTEFFMELMGVSERTQIPIEYLLAIINFETIGTFSPTAVPMRRDGTLVSSAVGLIQFIESTAIGLGTDRESLLNMTAIEQLQYVEAYFMQHSGKIKPGMSIIDAYLLVFRPASSGNRPGSVVYVRGSGGYDSNSHLDLNKDGLITIEEITRAFTSFTETRTPGLLSSSTIIRTEQGATTPLPSPSPVPAPTPSHDRLSLYESLGRSIYRDAGRVIVTAGWLDLGPMFPEGGHRGIDFVGTVGEGAKNIYSPIDGLSITQETSELGLTSIVKDIYGAYHIFGHLSSAIIQIGEGPVPVTMGTKLGVEGATGRGTGSHLHYDIRVPEENYNPDNFLRNKRLDYSQVKQIDPLEYLEETNFNFKNPSDGASVPNTINMNINIPLASSNPSMSAKIFENYFTSYLGA